MWEGACEKINSDVMCKRKCTYKAQRTDSSRKVRLCRWHTSLDLSKCTLQIRHSVLVQTTHYSSHCTQLWYSDWPHGCHHELSGLRKAFISVAFGYPRTRCPTRHEGLEEELTKHKPSSLSAILNFERSFSRPKSGAE